MAKYPVCCPDCQAPYQIEGQHLGRRARCKRCGARFVLALPGDPAVTSSSPWPWICHEPAAATVAATPPRAAAPPAEDRAPETWKPGDVILDLYEVEEVFTSGGRGLVYRVRHRGWNAPVAVKCPRPEYFRSEEDKRVFEAEAETWVNLGLHRHTATCYYVRRLGGIPRVFAEFVAGGSLAEWIRTHKLYEGGPAKTLERVLDVAIQFAWGLQHAHEQGLVHRDVKPGNVLLTPAGVVKVTDFGMAKARGRSAAGRGRGDGNSALVSAGGLTPAFCSPEQAERRPVSRKTDVWSWAVSVLEMFTGHVTWAQGFLAGTALRAYLDGDLPDARLPEMPPALASLLTRCLRPDPDDRPRDMSEIVAGLRDVYRQAAGRPYPRPAPQPAEALADGLNNRAVSLLDLNKHEEAERLWREALAAGPHHAEATYNLGLYQWRSGRLSDEAMLQRLREVCVAHPGDWRPVYLEALVHLDRADWPAALEALDRIVGADGGRDVVRAARAVARERQARARASLQTFTGHAGAVTSACISRDGHRALSGSADRTANVWDLADARCVRTLEGHGDWVTSVSLSSDGRRALSGGADKTVRLWEVDTGECLRVIEVAAKWVLAAALSPDGLHALVSGGDEGVALWDMETGKVVRTFPGHQGPVLALAWRGHGRRALSGSADRTLRLWDVETGQCLTTLSGHGDRVLGVALSDGGRWALSGSADRTMKLWDLESGENVRTLSGHAGGVFGVALSGDARYALSAGGEDRTARYWRLADGRCLQTLSGHTQTVNAVAFSADAKYALTASGDQTLARWRVKDVAAPYVVARVLSSEAAAAAQTSFAQTLARAWQAEADGDPVAAARWLREARAQPGYERTPEVMNQWARLYVRLPRRALAGGWEAHVFEGHHAAVSSVAVSGDGRLALSGSADRTLRLWEISTGLCLRTLEGHSGPVTAVALAGDGGLGLSASADRTVQAWDVSTGRCLRTFHGHDDVVTAVALSPDGRWAASGSTDRTVRVWDVASGRCLRTLLGHPDPVHAVSWSPDGARVLSGAAQFLTRGERERLFTRGQLRLWDAATGKCRDAWAGVEDAVTAVAMSLDGRLTLVGGGRSEIDHASGRFTQAGVLRLWENATESCRTSFEGHTGPVTSICLSADGRFVVSASTDRSVKLWNAADGACLRTLTGHADAVTSVALSPDGRHAISGSADRTLRRWVLDWELEDRPAADWDDDALPLLDNFLTLHTPFAGSLPRRSRRTVGEIVQLPLTQLFKSGPSEREIEQALTRRGSPVWTEEDFERLLTLLGCAGHGRLRPDGVRRRLEEMARKRKPPGSARDA
jgi:WD40 repeat protein/serine/threonine protein kinase